MRTRAATLALLCGLIALASPARADGLWGNGSGPCSAFGSTAGTCAQGSDARFPPGNWPTTTVNGDFLSFNGTTGAPQDSTYGPSSFVTPTTIDNGTLPISVTTFNASGASTVTSASFGLTGNQSASGIFGTSGIRYKNVAGTLNDTTVSGTIAANYDSIFGGNTLTATNATTITLDVGSYFKVPVCSTNVTCTANYALGADSIYSAGTITATGSVTLTGTYAGLTMQGAGGLISFANGNAILGYSFTQHILQIGAASSSPYLGGLVLGSSGSGTNSAAGNGEIDLPVGTGTGALPTFTLKAPTALQGSGSTAQTLTNVLDFNSTNSLAWTFGKPVYAATFNAGTQITVGGATAEGAGTINALTGYYADNTQGATCSGTPTSSFASIGGIVTHC